MSALFLIELSENMAYVWQYWVSWQWIPRFDSSAHADMGTTETGSLCWRHHNKSIAWRSTSDCLPLRADWFLVWNKRGRNGHLNIPSWFSKVAKLLIEVICEEGWENGQVWKEIPLDRSQSIGEYTAHLTYTLLLSNITTSNTDKEKGCLVKKLDLHVLILTMASWSN